jgi:hypothetical protein
MSLKINTLCRWRSTTRRSPLPFAWTTCAVSWLALAPEPQRGNHDPHARWAAQRCNEEGSEAITATEVTECICGAARPGISLSTGFMMGVSDLPARLI